MMHTEELEVESSHQSEPEEHNKMTSSDYVIYSNVAKPTINETPIKSDPKINKIIVKTRDGFDIHNKRHHPH